MKVYELIQELTEYPADMEITRIAIYCEPERLKEYFDENEGEKLFDIWANPICVEPTWRTGQKTLEIQAELEVL